MKQSVKRFVRVLALCGCGAMPAAAQLFNYTWTGVNLEVPDAPNIGDSITVSDTRSITTGFIEGDSQLTDLIVSLRFDGSNGAGGSGTLWNGDLLVTLTHQSGTSLTLLNRIGRDSLATSGYSGNGLDVTLDSSALVDVHLAGNGPLTGVFQPDGRSENPLTVTTASVRDATVFQFLQVMRTVSPDGQWTISATDLESGGLARLSSWGMSLTVVPEPEEYAAMALAGCVAFGIARRLRR
jgi:hypothetical protein